MPPLRGIGTRQPEVESIREDLEVSVGLIQGGAHLWLQPHRLHLEVTAKDLAALQRPAVQEESQAPAGHPSGMDAGPDLDSPALYSPSSVHARCSAADLGIQTGKSKLQPLLLVETEDQVKPREVSLQSISHIKRLAILPHDEPLPLVPRRCAARRRARW